MPCGKILRIAVLKPATVHWSLDDWNTTVDTHTRDTKLGVHMVDLPTDKLPVPSLRCSLSLGADGWEGVGLHRDCRIS